MNNLIIKNKIYIVRNKQVMLDSDIANIYGYLNGAKSINLAVKRNINSFNDNIYFQLTENEFSNLKFQTETSSLDTYGGKRKLPYVFTKEGIQILSNILRKENVKEITNEIINNFNEESSPVINNNTLQTIINKGISINDLIYNIRGKLVMLDADLAKLYQCINGTKEINQAVKRNIERFPEDFVFRLTKVEYESVLRSQFVTLELQRGKFSKYLPYAFTEQGVAMLSAILKTNVASQVSVKIMRAFVEMKKYIATNNFSNRISNLETKTIEHDNKINLILDKLSAKEVNNHIFYEGQIYDAYSLLINILNQSKKEIIIIDNYASKELFDIIKDINKNITIITKNIDEILIKKYKKQYNNINIIKSDIFHDRFIIIDNEILYHSGASFKDLGNKCFAINKIIDKDILNKLLLEINNHIVKP